MKLSASRRRALFAKAIDILIDKGRCRLTLKSHGRVCANQAVREAAATLGIGGSYKHYFSDKLSAVNDSWGSTTGDVVVAMARMANR